MVSGSRVHGPLVDGLTKYTNWRGRTRGCRVGAPGRVEGGDRGWWQAEIRCGCGICRRTQVGRGEEVRFEERVDETREEDTRERGVGEQG